MLVIIYNNLYIFNYIYIIKNSPQSGARVLGRAGGDGRRGDAPGGVERAPGRPGPQGGQLFLFSILKRNYYLINYTFQARLVLKKMCSNRFVANVLEYVAY